MKHSSTPNYFLLQLFEVPYVSAEMQLDLPEIVKTESARMRQALQELPKIQFSPSERSVRRVLAYAKTKEKR